MATRTKAPPQKNAPAPGQTVLALRQALIDAARALADATRPEWAGDTAVVTVLLDGTDGQAVVRFPSVKR
jgi:hypothetical protein